jgi:hypothetical protein
LGAARTVGGNTRYELFLPWAGFTDVAPSTLNEPTPDAFRIARKYHPAWARLSEPARKLHARNVHIILGRDCVHPVRMVLCWTPDGSVDGVSRDAGGTGMALRVARGEAPDATILNLSLPGHRERVEDLSSTLTRSEARYP